MYSIKFNILGYNTDMRNLFFTLLSICLLIALVPSVNAAKLRIKKSTGGSGTSLSYSSAKLSRSTNSIIVTFQNLTNTKRVQYELNYLANGVQQGAMGTISTTGLVSDSRDLYFGTCSHGVCTPHYNITNATLVVTAQLTSGSTNTKRYRIKI
jgi:hypothetical protein